MSTKDQRKANILRNKAHRYREMSDAYEAQAEALDPQGRMEPILDRNPTAINDPAPEEKILIDPDFEVKE